MPLQPITEMWLIIFKPGARSLPMRPRKADGWSCCEKREEQQQRIDTMNKLPAMGYSLGTPCHGGVLDRDCAHGLGNLRAILVERVSHKPQRYADSFCRQRQQHQTRAYQLRACPPHLPHPSLAASAEICRSRHSRLPS